MSYPGGHIRCGGYCTHVLDVATTAMGTVDSPLAIKIRVVANVVDLHPAGDWSDEHFIEVPVSRVAVPINHDLNVALAVSSPIDEQTPRRGLDGQQSHNVGRNGHRDMVPHPADYMAIRGVQGSDLWVANSAPGYYGVGDTLSRSQFNALGPVQIIGIRP